MSALLDLPSSYATEHRASAGTCTRAERIAVVTRGSRSQHLGRKPAFRVAAARDCCNNTLTEQVQCVSGLRCPTLGDVCASPDRQPPCRNLSRIRRTSTLIRLTSSSNTAEQTPLATRANAAYLHCQTPSILPCAGKITCVQ